MDYGDDATYCNLNTVKDEYSRTVPGSVTACKKLWGPIFLSIVTAHKIERIR